MSDEKVAEKVAAKPVENKSDKLEKQVASLAFTVRKIKDKLEEQLGMDINGDGRVGSGPFKKALAFLLIAGMASFCVAENTNIAVWVRTADVPTTFISGSGNIVAPYFSGDGSLLDNVVGVGSSLTPAYIWVGNRTTNAAAVAVSGDVTITTNGVVTIGSKKVLATMVALASNKVFIGNGSDAAEAQTLSGDVTVTTNGTTAVGSKKILATMVALASNKVFVGNGSGAAEAQTITGDITITTNGVTAVASLPAISGAALTTLTAANVGAVATGVNLTNSVLIANGTGGYTTNTYVFYPFGGGYIIKSITPVP